jgi:simple sugar transport system substrate-binding protein
VALTNTYGRSIAVQHFNEFPMADPAAIRSLLAETPLDCLVMASSAYFSAVYEVAPEYPLIQFVGIADPETIMQLTGSVNPLLPANLNIAWASLYEARFLAGFLAGMFAQENSINSLGYCAAWEHSEVLSGVNAYALGIQAANPAARLRVRVINTWFEPYTEKHCALAFVQEGVRLITHHSGSSLFFFS